MEASIVYAKDSLSTGHSNKGQAQAIQRKGLAKSGRIVYAKVRLGIGPPGKGKVKHRSLVGKVWQLGMEESIFYQADEM